MKHSIILEDIETVDCFRYLKIKFVFDFVMVSEGYDGGWHLEPTDDEFEIRNLMIEVKKLNGETHLREVPEWIQHEYDKRAEEVYRNSKEAYYEENRGKRKIKWSR